MVGVLIYGDTERSPALRHEVPLGIGDPFLYLESDGRRAVVTNALEDDRIANAAPELELSLLAVQRFGIGSAVVPPEFPLALADHLRAEDIELTPDDDEFDRRRRRK